MKTETISVPEIHCGHCKASIEEALQPIDGVARALVDVGARNVTVEFDDRKVDRDTLVAAIQDQGYDVP